MEALRFNILKARMKRGGMNAALQVLFGLILGAIGLAIAFGLMLRFHTDPSTAFAYVLFFMVLHWVIRFSLRLELALQFVAGALLCLASGFWLLGSDAPQSWGSEPQLSAASVAWRSLLVLVCLLPVPQGAEYLTLRSMAYLRRMNLRGMSRPGA